MDPMAPQAEKSQSAVKSASRTLDLIEFLARTENGASFNDVKAALDIPDSSLSQLLNTLVAREYVAHRGPRGGYALGPALGRLARQFVAGQSLAERLGRLCADLSRATGETVILHECSGHDVRIIAVHVPDDPSLIYAPKVGATAPLHVAAAGKVFLAALPDAFVADYLRTTALKPLPGREPTTPDAIARELDAVRAEGIARNNQESTAGIVALSVAVHRGGQPVASLTVGLPSTRYTAAVDAAIVLALKAAARHAEDLLLL